MAELSLSPARSQPAGPEHHRYYRPVTRTVSLVVRCFNEEAHIGRLLSGVVRQTRRPDEILIVDSGSTDATLAIASEFDVRILSIAPQEFSFGRALNRGIENITSELAVFASAHVYPIYDTWLEHLLAPLEEDDRVALSYGRQVIPQGGRYSESQLLARWFPRTSLRPQYHPFCNNANAAIRRHVWETIRFDESLTGLEDLDWGRRALDLGMVLAYVAEAPIVHVHNEDLAQVSNRYRREAIAHKQIYDEQRMSVAAAVRLTIANVAGDLRHAAREGRAVRHAKSIIGFRTAQFYGTYRGFTQTGPVTDLLRRRFYYPHYGVDREATPAAEIGRVLEYDAPVTSRNE